MVAYIKFLSSNPEKACAEASHEAASSFGRFQHLEADGIEAEGFGLLRGTWKAKWLGPFKGDSRSPLKGVGVDIRQG